MRMSSKNVLDTSAMHVIDWKSLTHNWLSDFSLSASQRIIDTSSASSYTVSFVIFYHVRAPHTKKYTFLLILLIVCLCNRSRSKILAYYSTNWWELSNAVLGRESLKIARNVHLH